MKVTIYWNSCEQVQKYISDFEDVLNDPPPPCLLLYFDETGFSKCPDKGKRKTVFVCKNYNVTHYWREDSGIHHISLAAWSSAEYIIFEAIDSVDKCYYKTKKGYITQESKLFWLKDIIKRYVEQKPKEINGNYRCVIICDSCSALFSDQITQVLNENGNISFLSIPAHSSHLTQMLGVTVFLH